MLSYLFVCALAVALGQDVPEDAPQSMKDLCRGNIISWANIPHDWQEDADLWRGDGTAQNGRKSNYVGKDWWYWKADWKEKIANGDVDMEPRLDEEYLHAFDADKPKPLVGKCGTTALRSIASVATVSECRLACAFEYSTQNGDLREKCRFFSYEDASKQCILYSRCNWSYDQSGTEVTGDALDDRACYGQETRSDACSWKDQNGNAQQVWKTYRIVDIYPAGFQNFSLREFNQPPLCIHVPQSSDKKVEVMIETEMNDSRICIMDGRDMGVYTNDVGNVRTCDNGKLYSCFTAATRRQNDEGEEEIKDFYFYISCEGSCEASDVDVWIRLRKSERSWDEGKQDWESDIEYWCENERGTLSAEKQKPDRMHEDFSYPSELLPNKPREYPYRITHGLTPSSAGVLSSTFACLVGLLITGYRLL